MAIRISESPEIISSIGRTDEKELQRRRTALMSAAADADIDAILAVNGMELFQGAARYISDIPYTHYPYAVLLGKEGISFVSNGSARGGEGVRPYMGWYAKDGFVLSAGQPGMPTLGFADSWLPEKLLISIRKYGYKNIGLAHSQCIPYSIIHYLEENVPGIRFVDFSNQVNRIMAVKSEYEIEHLYKPSVALHDRIFSNVPNMIKPGRSCHDIALQIKHLCVSENVIHTVILVDSHPTAPIHVPYHYDNYPIGEHDIVQVLIELCSPSGIWTEVSRMISIGEPNPETLKVTNDAIEMQDKIAAFAVPGVRACDLYNYKAQLLEEKGYAPDKCFDIHGSGYSAIESPTGLAEDEMELEENMFMNIHPTCTTATANGSSCDAFLVTKAGSVCLSKTPRKMIII